MSWATAHIAALAAGATVQFRPRGHSMTPLVRDNDLVTVEPIAFENVRAGDIVLCRVCGKDYLHLVKVVSTKGACIMNAAGFVNGWTSRIYGIVTAVSR